MKSGNAVLINVQLIDARTDNHLWAESYKRTLDDIFGVEGEVAEKIAGSLQARLSPDEASRLAAVPTTKTANQNIDQAKMPIVVQRSMRLKCRQTKASPRRFITRGSSRGQSINECYYFWQPWLLTVQDVLQADWQEVWHSPHPPVNTVLASGASFTV